MMTLGKRLGLLFAYFVFTGVMVWVFADSFLGPILFGLFVSWAWLPLSGLEVGPGSIMAVYLLYIFSLFLINKILGKRVGWKHPYLSEIIYGVGSALAILDKNISLSSSVIFNILGAFLCVTIIILYLEIDWNLVTKTANRPRIS